MSEDPDLVVAIAEAVPKVAGSGEAVDLLGEFFQQCPEAGPHEVGLGIVTCQQRLANGRSIMAAPWEMENCIAHPLQHLEPGRLLLRLDGPDLSVFETEGLGTTSEEAA